MRLSRVPLHQQPGRFVQVEPGATRGAMLGRDLYGADGSVLDAAALASLLATEAATAGPVTYWRYLQNIPANVTALAGTPGTGLFAVTGPGTGAFRSIAVSADLTVSDEDGVSGNPTIGLADLADAGGGSIRKFDRDSKGRVAGTSAADTDDLSEGATNLYFTQVRVQETPLASYTVATLPAATTPGLMIYVSDEPGGAALAFSDGTDWRRVGALDPDLEAIAALAGTAGLLRKIAADTWALDTNTYLTANQTITLSGDVTGSGATGITATIAADSVTNTKLADMATQTFKGRNTAGTGDPEDLSVSTVRTMLSINNVDNTSDADKPVSTAQQAALDLKVNLADVGVANGVASLDSGGKVPAAQLPSYVDDVLEFANLAGFPGTGETGKIYVAIDTGYTYRWSGSAYVRVGAAAMTADEALKLTTPRSISATGDASWTVNFDGSANVSAALTLANSGVVAGTYNNVATQVRPFTVDAKGRVTAIGSAVTITPAFSSITGKPTTLAGYGITDAPKKFSQAIVGGATSEVITHNLGTRDAIVQVFRSTAPYDQVELDIEMTTTNTTTLRFATPPGAGEYRVVIQG